jgi:hypothetical protein
VLPYAKREKMIAAPYHVSVVLGVVVKMWVLRPTLKKNHIEIIT